MPGDPALAFGDRAYTHAELDAAVDRAASALAGLDLRRGDRFALMATNSDRFVVTFYAALRYGAIVVPVNPASAPPAPGPSACWPPPRSGARARVLADGRAGRG